MMYSRAILLLVFCLLASAAARLRRNQGVAPSLPVDGSDHDEHYGNDDNDENVLTCRVTVTHTSFENEDGTMGNRYEHVCIPVVNGTQTPFMHTVEFPESFIQDNQEQLDSRRSFFVAIRGAQLHNRRMLLQENAKFTILEEDPTRSGAENRRNDTEDDGGRILQTYPRMPYTHAKGDRILSIVTISTSDASTHFSASELKQSYFNQGDCLQSQWKKCSANQFNWVEGEFINVEISGRISSYQTGGDAREEAIRQMKSDGLYRDDVQELGDNIVFVIPEGTREGFVANAAIDFFVATFSDKWAYDLRAVSHELGHNFGLGHAGLGNDPYGDFSGYMASTSGPEKPDGPLMCFNAFNHYDLEWFPSMSIKGSKKVRLTSFVKYDTRSSRQGDVVILEVNNEMFIQYNEATQYNKGTGAMASKVVVVTARGADTERRAGLDVGGKFSFGSTNVEVCAKENGAMIVGVGNARNLCSLPLENDNNRDDNPNQPPTRPRDPPRRPDDRPAQPPDSEDPTLTCPDTSDKYVSFTSRGEVLSLACRDIDSRHCKKENLDNTNEFQRVFQVCEQQCPKFTGCGRTPEDIQNKPRPCIREGRGVTVKVSYRGNDKELTCRTLGSRPDLLPSFCPLDVIPDVFESKRPKVQDVCEYECAEFLSCARSF